MLWVALLRAAFCNADNSPSDRVDEEFGGDDGRRGEAGGGVEEAQARLFADVGEMAEIPGDEVIELIDGGDGVMHGVREEAAVDDAAFDVAFGEDGGLFRDVELVRLLSEVEVAGAVRFGKMFEFAADQK